MKNDKNTYPLFIIALALLASTMMGCTEYRTYPVEYRDQVTYFQGDPLELIAGTSGNQHSFMNTNNFEEFNGYTLSEVFVYRNIEEQQNGYPQGNIGKLTTNSPQTPFSFEENNGSAYYKFEDSSKQLSLILKEYNGQLNIQELQYEGVRHAVAPVHYSLSADKNIFSVLLLSRSYNSQNRKSYNELTVLYFEKPVPISEVYTPQVSNKHYKYMSEKYSLSQESNNSMIRWENKTISLNICGARALAFKSYIQKGVNSWNEALKGVARIRLNEIAIPPPFSDVNTSCLYLTNKFSFMEFEGMDHFIEYNGRIRPHSMFIYQSLKLTNSSQGRLYTSTPQYDNSALVFLTRHEVGHFLGLDHQFDVNYKSIMAYHENQSYDLSDYDKEAILNLYQD